MLLKKKAFKPLVCRAGNQEMVSCWRRRRGRIPDCPWYCAPLGKMKPETSAKKNFINKFGNLFCLLMLSCLPLNKIYQALLSTWCPRCQGLRDEKNSGTFLQGVWLPGQRESNPGRQCCLQTQKTVKSGEKEEKNERSHPEDFLSFSFINKNFLAKHGIRTRRT